MALADLIRTTAGDLHRSGELRGRNDGNEDDQALFAAISGAL
jgi:hypothetical protein